jgi:hypothetical protein
LSRFDEAHPPLWHPVPTFTAATSVSSAAGQRGSSQIQQHYHRKNLLRQQHQLFQLRGHREDLRLISTEEEAARRATTACPFATMMSFRRHFNHGFTKHNKQTKRQRQRLRASATKQKSVTQLGLPPYLRQRNPSTEMPMDTAHNSSWQHIGTLDGRRCESFCQVSRKYGREWKKIGGALHIGTSAIHA